MRNLSIIVLFFFLMTGCGSMQSPMQTAASYHSTTPSSPKYSSSNSMDATDSMNPEPKSDKVGIALLATLGGLLAIAGIVVPLVLIK